LTGSSSPFEEPKFEIIDEWLSKANREVNHQSDGLWSRRSRSLLMRIIVLIQEAYEDYFENNISPSELNKPEAYVSFILKHIHSYYTNEIRISALCDLAHVGRTTLSKNFKRITGSSISDYIIDYRMQIAERDLEFTDLSINEISKECGFNFSTYFIKQFVIRHGISPSNYRKMAVARRKSDFHNDTL
jgi:AraC-like DNA-binding protein